MLLNAREVNLDRTLTTHPAGGRGVMGTDVPDLPPIQPLHLIFFHAKGKI